MENLDRSAIFGPWPPRRRQGFIRQIRPEELPRWVLFEDEDLWVIDKPPDVVCHPSKEGPWSSLVGAAREFLGLDAVHLIFRLDRETSGVVVLAKNPACGRRLQMAAQDRRYAKSYLAILRGELVEPRWIDAPIGDDPLSVVTVKGRVVGPGEGQSARTQFQPLAWARGYTLVRVRTETGRKHQIRVHAEWAGFPLVGDKIYGGDSSLFLQFIETGWTDALAERLLLPRQALHCESIDLRPAGFPWLFRAPLAPDLREFCQRQLGFDEIALESALAE